jgi:streptogramin lyase
MTLRSIARRQESVLLAFSVLLALFAPATVESGSPITEFPLSKIHSFPNAIAAGPDGNVWFCEGGSGKIGRATPDGLISEFSTSLAPVGITSGPDGNLWYVAVDEEFGGSLIGRLTPDGQRTEFSVFQGNLSGGIVAGPDGNLWFTQVGSTNSIGRITPAGVINTFPILGNAQHWQTSIALGPDGNLWFAEPGSRRIGRMSTVGETEEFEIPVGWGPFTIVAGPDGNLWFTGTNGIGRITTSGEVAVFPVAADALAVGPDGNLWFADSSGNRVGRLSIAFGKVVPDAIVAMPTANAGNFWIAAGPDGNVWFTESKGNAIGRIDLSAVCAPGTLCLGGRFEVSAAWEGGGSSGAGMPVSLTDRTGAFWFFQPSNLEVFIKILDSCAGTGSFNVYVNGLTHAGVTLTVTDKQTGASRSFVNPGGAAFSLLFDGSTFSCP